MLFRSESRIEFAASYGEARRLLAEGNRIDCILLDLGLPDGSGRELLDEVKASDSPLPVVVYSAQEINAQVRARADSAVVKSRRALPKLASTVMEVVDRHGGPQ